MWGAGKGLGRLGSKGFYYYLGREGIRDLCSSSCFLASAHQHTAHGNKHALIHIHARTTITHAHNTGACLDCIQTHKHTRIHRHTDTRTHLTGRYIKPKRWGINKPWIHKHARPSTYIHRSTHAQFIRVHGHVSLTHDPLFPLDVVLFVETLKVRIENEVHRLVVTRDRKYTNFVEVR